MPSIRYVNQSAPFWDFIAAMENQGPQHPFFAGENREESSDEEGRQWRGRGGRGSFFRGPPGPWGRHPHYPPPPHHGGPPPPPPPHHEGHPPQPPAPGSNPEDAAQPQEGEPRHDGPPHPHRHPRCGSWGRRGGRPGSFGRGGRPGSFGRGGWGHGPFAMGGPFGFGGLAEAFQKQLFGDSEEKEAGQDDFQPEADVFDTESAYVIHVSLPGAKKEDVGVSWDAEKSELTIAGVIHRPGDEDFLKTLAMDERKVGAFERKIRLGSRANPAQVDDDVITAKLEDGILRVEVPKLDKDYVEIKKVDIQ